MGTENVKLGVCTVKFDGVDLGLTKGGVEVDVTTTTHEVMVDQYGNSPVNEYIMARTVVAKVPLAETTLANLEKIMPGTTLISGGGKEKGNVTNGVGLNLLDVAAKLVLHPKALSSSDHSEDFTIPLAATAGAIQFAYKIDQERIFNVEFKGYPDSDTGLLFVIGDETASA